MGKEADSLQVGDRILKEEEEVIKTQELKVLRTFEKEGDLMIDQNLDYEDQEQEMILNEIDLIETTNEIDLREMI